MRKRKILGSLKMILLITAIVFVALYFLGNNTNLKLKVTECKKSDTSSIVIEDYFDKDKYLKILKSEPSDIKGMSKYDKYKKGLDPEDNSDTDLDGLTDREEIEKYHTDPSKYSTSGDLYSDKYKVEHKMDVNKNFKGNKGLQFENNECSEIILKSSNARDYQTVVKDYTGIGAFKFPDKEVVKEYFISMYSGTLSIDLEKVDKHLKADDVTVYMQDWFSDKAYITAHKSDGTIITLKKEFDAETPYVIYLVNGSNTLTKTFSSFDAGTEISCGQYGDTDVEDLSTGIPTILCYGSEAFGRMTGTELMIVYDDTDPNYEKALKETITIANDILGREKNNVSDYSNLKVMSRSKINDIVKNNSENWLQKFHFDMSYKEKHEFYPFYFSLYTWFTYEDIVGLYNNNSDSENTDNDSLVVNQCFVPVTGFNMRGDILPFHNFDTILGSRQHGNCAGIAHLTTELFNTGTLSEPTGIYTDGTNNITFDVTKDMENQTLLNKGLYDYKNSEFVSKHKADDETLSHNLSLGEAEFAKMIEYYWIKGNNAFRTEDYVKHVTEMEIDDFDTWLKYQTYDGSIIKNITKQLDAGKIVDAYFLLKINGKSSNSGHVVNIIGYEKDTPEKYKRPDADCRIFYVYDNNNPNVIGTLVTQVVHFDRGREILYYKLNVKDVGYTATSGKNSLFVALDENFNVLN